MTKKQKDRQLNFIKQILIISYSNNSYFASLFTQGSNCQSQFHYFQEKTRRVAHRENAIFALVCVSLRQEAILLNIARYSTKYITHQYRGDIAISRDILHEYATILHARSRVIHAISCDNACNIVRYSLSNIARYCAIFVRSSALYFCEKIAAIQRDILLNIA